MTEQEKMDLLNDVKNYLRITWDDEDADIQKMISRSVAYFKSVTGADVDFVQNEQARQLLLDRCRYVRNYATEEFETNFLSELINLQISVLPSTPTTVEGESDGL